MANQYTFFPQGNPDNDLEDRAPELRLDGQPDRVPTVCALRSPLRYTPLVGDRIRVVSVDDPPAAPEDPYRLVIKAVGWWEDGGGVLTAELAPEFWPKRPWWRRRPRGLEELEVWFQDISAEG